MTTLINQPKTGTDIDFATRVMLVTLSVSRWRARATDKKVNKEVATAHNTVDSIGNYRKSLLPQDAATYAAIVTAEGAARTYHYANTLPWSDTGARVLPAANYMQYCTGMRKCVADYESACAAFYPEYPQLREDAKKLLNGLYKDSDYPDAKDMPSYFGMKYVVTPVPMGDDFRVDLPQEIAEDLRSEIEANTVGMLDAAMSDAWQQLYKCVKHFRQEMEKGPAANGKAKGVQWASLIDNMSDLCDVMPRLNIKQDPHMDAMTIALKRDVLSGLTPETAKTASKVKIARTLAEVEAAMKAFV